MQNSVSVVSLETIKLCACRNPSCSQVTDWLLSTRFLFARLLRTEMYVLKCTC